MDIKEIIVILGMLTTLVLSVIALYKSLRVTPKEIKTADVDLSEKYSDLAERSLKRANESETKLRAMEDQVLAYQRELRELEAVIDSHEEQIKALKDKIAQQEKEIAELKAKVLAQDAELVELKKKLAT